MSRTWMLAAALLLAATGAALADDVPGRAEPATTAGTPETVPAVAADAAGDADDADENGAPAEARANDGPKVISGMSILGNQEAPKALVIVPWKSSEIGASMGIPTMLDDSVQPVDRDVFLRALSYYEIRSETTP